MHTHAQLQRRRIRVCMASSVSACARSRAHAPGCAAGNARVHQQAQSHGSPRSPLTGAAAPSLS
eukprot:2179994-Pleurochrysis_carterae.AAC.1